MGGGKLIEHLGCEVATPGVTTEPPEAWFVNRHDGDVIWHWKRTSSPCQPVPGMELQLWHPPANEHPQPRRNQQQSSDPTDLRRFASGWRIVLAGHFFPGHCFRSEQHIKIAPEPARVISEEYAMERITQVRMDIQGVEVVCQIESANGKSQRVLVPKGNIL
jgi:hypothetical protein